MPQNSIKRNYLLNLFATITGLLFPLITFPYAARVLMADGIGQIQFLQAIIDYISLCTSIGIPLYAVREIAKIRDNKELISKTTIEILVLHSLLTLVGYIVVLILVVAVVEIKVNAPLFLLISMTLAFNTIGVAWFYQAIEDFKYIAIRSFVVRIISLIALFVFVKTEKDLLYYAAILVVGTVGNNFFNFFRLRKHIVIGIKGINIWRHLIPSLKIFMLNLIVSIYVNLDTVMLGFLKNETSVGYYTAAIRLTKAILGIVSSLGVVLLPRFSNMLSRGEIDEFRLLSNKAVSFVIGLSLPMSLGLIFMASSIINLFCGNGFEPSVLTLQLLAPIIIFIGLSGLIGLQILYPLGLEKYVIISTLVGAFSNFTLNYLLIPEYGQYGAAFSTLIAELLVLFVMIRLGKQYIFISFFSVHNMHYVIGTVLVLGLLSILSLFSLNDICYLLLGIPTSIVIYFVYLLLVRDTIVVQTKNIILLKLKFK